MIGVENPLRYFTCIFSSLILVQLLLSQVPDILFAPKCMILDSPRYCLSEQTIWSSHQLIFSNSITILYCTVQLITACSASICEPYFGYRHSHIKTNILSTLFCLLCPHKDNEHLFLKYLCCFIKTINSGHYIL